MGKHGRQGKRRLGSCERVERHERAQSAARPHCTPQRCSRPMRAVVVVVVVLSSSAIIENLNPAADSWCLAAKPHPPSASKRASRCKLSVQPAQVSTRRWRLQPIGDRGGHDAADGERQTSTGGVCVASQTRRAKGEPSSQPDEPDEDDTGRRSPLRSTRWSNESLGARCRRRRFAKLGAPTSRAALPRAGHAASPPPPLPRPGSFPEAVKARSIGSPSRAPAPLARGCCRLLRRRATRPRRARRAAAIRHPAAVLAKRRRRGWVRV